MLTSCRRLGRELLCNIRLPGDVRGAACGPHKLCGACSDAAHVHTQTTCANYASLIALKNASWSINSLKVYSKLLLNGNVTASAGERNIDPVRVRATVGLLLAGTGILAALGTLW